MNATHTHVQRSQQVKAQSDGAGAHAYSLSTEAQRCHDLQEYGRCHCHDLGNDGAAAHRSAAGSNNAPHWYPAPRLAARSLRRGVPAGFTSLVTRRDETSASNTAGLREEPNVFSPSRPSWSASRWTLSSRPAHQSRRRAKPLPQSPSSRQPHRGSRALPASPGRAETSPVWRSKVRSCPASGWNS